jgi:hypothetical protein
VYRRGVLFNDVLLVAVVFVVHLIVIQLQRLFFSLVN